MHARIHRRDWLRAGAGLAALASTADVVAGDSEGDAARRESTVDARPEFRFCLNTSTIRGQNLSLLEQIDVVTKAGYDGIEPWMRDIEAFVQGGGKLDDARKKIADAGLVVPSAIGFASWIVDDDAKRAEGLAAARHDMEQLAAIGGVRLAAPPVGATQQAGMDLQRVAERYRALLEIGDRTGVVPELELWGFSRTLSRLGELAFVAAECGHPGVCLLPDVYHIHKGGSDFEGLRLINGRVIHVFHMNDYPAEPTRESIQDAHRVYPGDGVAPLSTILRILHETGCRAMLSLELFNPEYWKRDAFDVARTGLEKMRTAVAKAFDGD
ncbi:MAG: sugar phosphate isomerase/epimerase [Planctomycetes bacterium]|nr:sugar phosphate isomerase/epimerase [Planctomycetota bacterium]